MPLHFAVRTRPRLLAFRTHTSARVLWDALLTEVPDPLALCLMPDHVHLLHTHDVSRGLGLALRTHARWRNRQLGRTGSLWQRVGPPEPVRGETKLRRTERYIHLNPCRAGLVADPLAWAWSTHRDRVGLAVPGARPPVPDPHAYHHYLSADPSVDQGGTLLPTGTDQAPAEAVFAAVSELTRTPWEGLRVRGTPRRLVVSGLRLFTDLSVGEMAVAAGLNRSTVQRTPAQWTPATRVVSRVLGDPRFPGLSPGELTRLRGWERYRGRR